eukprot:g1036.t1
MSVSLDQHDFILPDFTAPEFSVLDVPSTERVTDYILSSASFTSWQNTNMPNEDKTTNPAAISNVEVCCSLEHTLEKCESTSVQKCETKPVQNPCTQERDGLTFPKNEMIIIADPHMTRIHETDKKSEILGLQDSSKSLYRPSTGVRRVQSLPVNYGWVNVEFWVIDDKSIELDFIIIDEASRPFYIMEKEREIQFYIQNEPIRNLNYWYRESNGETGSETEDEFDQIANSSECGHSSNTAITRSVHGRHGRLTKLIKSVSMTTLVVDQAQDSNFASPEASNSSSLEEYCCDDSDGIKSPYPTDFGFSSMSFVDHSSGWSTSTPKLPRNLQKKLKRKWQPVSRAMTRCYSIDGCASSVDSSSRWMQCSIRRALHRMVCCGTTLSSDDDDSR